ncbi:MAG: MFS transporter [Acidobacteriaceae bacterium]
MTQPGAPERRATRLVFLLCGMAQSSWAPLVPYAKARVHANNQHFGLLLLCFGAGSILSMPAMGGLVSRYGCKRLIQFSAGTIFLGLVAVSVAPSSTLLALSLFLFGASIGAIDVVMNVQASLVERHSGENLMSGFHGLYSVGGFLGALVMSGLLWLNTPAGAAALIIIFLLFLLLLLANPALLPYGDVQQERTKRFTWPDNYVLFLAVLAFIMMLAEGSMLDWSAVFLVDKAGMAEKNAGIGFTAFSIAMTISRFGGNHIIQKIGRRWTITAGALIAAGGFFVVTLLANPAGSVFGFAMIGLGAANVVPLIFSLASESRGALGSNISFVSSIGYTGILTGPAVIGFVTHSRGFGVAFGGVACLLILVALAGAIAVPSQVQIPVQGEPAVVDKRRSHRAKSAP